MSIKTFTTQHDMIRAKDKKNLFALCVAVVARATELYGGGDRTRIELVRNPNHQDGIELYVDGVQIERP